MAECCGLEAKVVIFTALHLERREVRKHLSDVRNAHVNGIDVDFGKLAECECSYTVGIVETGPGNVDASVAAVQVVDDLDAEIVVVVGIAGGLKDVRVGDVVISSKVYWVEAGKEKEFYQTRPDFGPVSEALVQRARTVVVENGWRGRAKSPGEGLTLNGEDAEALVAPIAVSEQVVSSRESDVVSVIQQGFGDAVAVEMESVGILKAVHQVDGCHGLAIRGISDLLEGKEEVEEHGSQAHAAANAAGFVVELLATLCEHEMEPPEPASHEQRWATLVETVQDLYPTGPMQRNVWERAGGDPSHLNLDGSGGAVWWRAIRTLRRGGGGERIEAESLIEAMREDWPRNEKIRRLGELFR